MITPFLERLIMTGKARSKNFVAGGGQKSILRIPKDKTIIIHHFSHFPFMPEADQDNVDIWLTRVTTQMRIFSRKSDTHYVIRNAFGFNFSQDELGLITTAIMPGPEYQEDVYLVHDNDVSFTFQFTTRATPIVTGVAPTTVEAKPPTRDYGKLGQKGTGGPPIAITQKMGVGIASEFRPIGEYSPATPGVLSSMDQVGFPLDASTAIPSADLDQHVQAYPLVNVQYVEIDGNPAELWQPSNN